MGDWGRSVLALSVLCLNLTKPCLERSVVGVPPITLWQIEAAQQFVIRTFNRAFHTRNIRHTRISTPEITHRVCPRILVNEPNHLIEYNQTAGLKTSLKPGGLVVFNEVVWLVDEDARADPVRDFWRAYPSMTDIAGVESAVESADYELLGGFNLPESDWWDAYYAPLEARLCEVEAKYGQSEDATPPIAHTREEIDLRRRFADAYNYRFFAARMR